MLVGILLVAMAAVFSAGGSVLESQGAKRAATGTGIGAATGTATGQVGFGLLVRQPRYVVGLLVDVLGFVGAAAAMQYLPLFMVQAGVASSVGLTAVLSVLLGVKLSRRAVVALSAMLIGLVLLAISASTDPAVDLNLWWKWTMVALVLPVAGLAWLALRTGTGRLRAVSLAFVAGLGFTVVAVAARTLDVPDNKWALLIDPNVLAIAFNGAVATGCFAAALQHGSVTLVSAVNYTTETVLPSAIGLTLLGDHVRGGLAGLAAVGFVLAIGGALVLAEGSRLPVPGRAVTPVAVPSPG